jgi:hypothetical protein
MAGDQVIADFSYDDGWHPTTDGQGPSLQVVNEAGDPQALGTAAAWRPSTVLGGSPGRSEGPVPGDSNHDGIFNSADLVLVLAAGKYEDNIANNATFEEGDWNGDGDFTTADLVYAMQAGTYVSAASPADVNLALVADLDPRGTDRSNRLDAAASSSNELDAWYADLAQDELRERLWLP